MHTSRFVDEREGPAHFVGVIESVEAMSGPTKNSRYSILLDVAEVQSSELDELPIATGFQENPTALVRVVTTINRIKELSGEERHPKEGNWVAIGTQPAHLQGLQPTDQRYLPWTWINRFHDLNLAERRQVRLNRFEYIDESNEPQSLSAATTKSAKRRARAGKKIRKIFDLNSLNITGHQILKNIRKLKNTPSTLHACVRDVGQASYVTFDDGTNIAVAFDIGWPLPWNAFTAPKKSPPLPTQNGVIILSHWDWDHFFLGLRNYKSLNCIWVAPPQIVGPAAFRFAERMVYDGNLFLSHRSGLQVGPLTIHRCTCKKRDDRNNSGIYVKIPAPQGEILLTGDADYGSLKTPDRAGPYAGITIPHHGGKLTSLPPAPIFPQQSKAIVSYGSGNTYKHPSQATLQEHRNMNWNVEATAPGSSGRGDRTF